MLGQRLNFDDILNRLSEAVGTEQPNPHTANIDQVDPEAVVRLINAEDKLVALAVEKVSPEIAVVAQKTADGISKGGRLFYIGAGTSGRLGVLDASECPPTFGVSAETVQGIIAGGDDAMRNSIEGAEDNAAAGREAIIAKQIGANDVVVGISANGNAPYVVEALKAAKERGAYTAGITCNLETQIKQIADTTIIALVGPEAIAGSSRMKAGTAQKMILNQISTTAMVLLGKTYGNVMVDVQVKNEKLKQRALKIITAFSQVTKEKALEYLEAANRNVKTAIVMAVLQVDANEAQAKLTQHGQRLRAVFGT